MIAVFTASEPEVGGPLSDNCDRGDAAGVPGFACSSPPQFRLLYHIWHELRSFRRTPTESSRERQI